MDLRDSIALLVSGGILTAGGTLLGTLLQNKSEEKRAKIKRTEDILDRNFNLKKEAYFQALKEFNESALARFSGIGNRALTPEELTRRNAAMTLFDMYAPDNIKSHAAVVMHLLQISIPTELTERMDFEEKLLNEIKKLSLEIRKDLGIN